jgi:hypothetical protein
MFSALLLLRTLRLKMTSRGIPFALETCQLILGSISSFFGLGTDNGRALELISDHENSVISISCALVNAVMGGK